MLGGIGFTWEHDAHLYLRRALALRQLLGGSAAWRERTAALALAGAPAVARRACRRWRPMPTPSGGGCRARVGADRGPAAQPERRAALADAGYLAPHWPAPYGLGASPGHQLIIDEELSRAGRGAPGPGDRRVGGADHPAARHRRPSSERFAGPSLRGEITWCQLFSEPEAGSDLASLRTRAVRVDGGWRLTGQKVWTSLAAQADWAICLARTDPGRPSTAGSPTSWWTMRSPGIEIRPLREITGRAVFNEVFLDDVFVPDDCVVGAPGDGWRLARATLEHERVAMGRGSALGEDVEQLLDGRPVGRARR